MLVYLGLTLVARCLKAPQRDEPPLNEIFFFLPIDLVSQRSPQIRHVPLGHPKLNWFTKGDLEL